MDIACVGKVKGKINSFLPFDSFKTNSTKKLDEKVIMKKIEQKRRQIGEMIIRGCYVKELQKEVFDLDELLNKTRQ